MKLLFALRQAQELDPSAQEGLQVCLIRGRDVSAALCTDMWLIACEHVQSRSMDYKMAARDTCDAALFKRGRHQSSQNQSNQKMLRSLRNPAKFSNTSQHVGTIRKHFAPISQQCVEFCEHVAEFGKQIAEFLENGVESLMRLVLTRLVVPREF